MITEIPTSSDYYEAGLNQLYLAWQMSIQAVQGYEQIEDILEPEDQDAAAAQYWAKSQPMLANAFGLIQQAMEMALKGRIAAISPFLLISREPRDWPRGPDSKSVPFSDFRTLDAADLLKVHNTFAALPLAADFRTFWDDVRRDRNRIMHSVHSRNFDPATLLRTAMLAAKALFDNISWSQHLTLMELDGRYASYGLDDGTQNVVMAQVDIAIRHLAPADQLRFFGFDAKRRAYLCPTCYDRANQDWQDDWPKLAQLTTKSASCRTLFCVVCVGETEIERKDCNHSECVGNVLHEDFCLTCLGWQDDPRGFASGFERGGDSSACAYDLRYESGGRSTYDTLNFSNDEDAREHARLLMLAPHLSHCSSVNLRRAFAFDSDGISGRGAVIGTWIRKGSQLVWEAKAEPPLTK